jgi:hypothetical protein
VDGPLGRSAGSGAEYRTVPCQGAAAAAAALGSGRTLVMSFVGSVIRRKTKITTPKHFCV